MINHINPFVLFPGNRAYDISNAVFVDVALHVGDEDTVPRDMLFNNDGSVLYVLGSTGDDINEYALSTPYDISTGSFTQIALSISSQEINPQSMMYNNDGSKLYLIGSSGDDINEYALSTPYDISTGSFTQIALYVGDKESSPKSMLFNADGSVLYITGFSEIVNEYSLSTLYDISTGVFVDDILNMSTTVNDPQCMIFNNDGSVLYVLDASRKIYSYQLSTLFDVSTASSPAEVLDVVTVEGSPTSMLFNNDGSVLYVLGSSSDNINEYALS